MVQRYRRRDRAAVGTADDAARSIPSCSSRPIIMRAWELIV